MPLLPSFGIAFVRLAVSEHRLSAILFASVTVGTIGGLRSSIRANQVPLGKSRRHASADPWSRIEAAGLSSRAARLREVAGRMQEDLHPVGRRALSATALRNKPPRPIGEYPGDADAP